MIFRLFTLCYLFLFLRQPTTSAQRSFCIGDSVKEFSFSKVSNNKAGTASLPTAASVLTILDFFGTWCVPCLFPGKREKSLRVDKIDYRIHFALNCGAKSCPPIASYNYASLDAQPDVATRAYLPGEASYDSENNIVYLPRLMSWFRADFGGKSGISTILNNFEIIPARTHPAVEFKTYDWRLAPGNYSDQPFENNK